MKRAFSLLLLSLFAVVAMAQHMKFMGIPIDGTIDSFEQKLAAKGVKPKVEFNRTNKDPYRVFTGMFFGNSAGIYVYYDPKTKVVYRAKAVIENNDKTAMMNLYDEVVKSMTDKYGEGEEDTTSSGLPQMYYLPELNGRTIGVIDVFPATYEIDYETHYCVCIDYYDYTNRDKFKATKADDL